MIHLPAADKPLTEADAHAAFDAILNGSVDDGEIARFLVTLADRGKSVDEVVAAALALRSSMTTISAPANAIDVVGTGGDGAHTLNVSTAVAIVVAACGIPVAKHGNRAASSKSGAADVLAVLGIDVDIGADVVERSIAEIGIGFLFAAKHHPVVARVAGVRRALGRRTIFNLLGPLANPAGVKRQLLGVYDPRWARPIAEALGRLGSERAMVVHGNGLDEITLSGTTAIATLTNGTVADSLFNPEEAGLARHPVNSIRGGEPEGNAAAILQLLAGARGAYRDFVCLNAAGALLVAEKASDWPSGVAIAADAIDSGAAADLLARWRDFR